MASSSTSGRKAGTASKKAGNERRTGTGDAARGRFNVTREGIVAATGSRSAAFQNKLFAQVAECLWHPAGADEDALEASLLAAYDALHSIAPRTELEGMQAAQMIATHNAAMECMRRAMLPNQTFEGRDQNLKHAVKLMGIYERQIAALDKHRGKEQQKITVEHVTVEAGGQAIVGNVHRQGGRAAREQEQSALTDDSAAEALSREALKQPRHAKVRSRKTGK